MQLYDVIYAMASKKSSLCERIREIRKIRNLSQAELGVLAKLPAAAISHLETGHQEPALKTLLKLADALQVSMDYLAGRTNDPTPVGKTVEESPKTKLAAMITALSDDDVAILLDLGEKLTRRREH